MKHASWATLLNRNAALLRQAAKPLRERHRPPASSASAGSWLMGLVMAADGPRRYYLFRPAGVRFGERLPLLVMLHGCHQDAKSFADSTRMNSVAVRERFLVLYPEQPRVCNAQGCWNWFDTQSGRAFNEAAWLMKAVDQVCVLYAADRERIAVAGLSAGASMAALLATRYPQRFKALVMHSGVPPGAASSPASALGAMRGRREPLAPGDVAGHWPPLMVIHGEADGVVSARNAGAAAQMWSEAAGASASEPQQQRRGQRYPMTVTQFKRARQVVATLVEVGGLGHAWSGGAARQHFSDANGPDASRMIWRFAARQFDTPTRG
ncbi:MULTISPECIES: PHB depolymerase family esterase [unclassified Roseateles]|uniref:extracellular catalytic domain type 1 short-chain-length polyhydroxyalkanoate depolymerase n=1 Tax=unclassified Roseateles TaxID=2626991 RepID=UPI0009EA2E01|nr:MULTISPECIES: PHB depolymerase family esterase [unclassified Roseateles]